jgi:hypothetical protein
MDGTKKHLLAYQISGQTVGVDIDSWDDEDLNGNPAFKIILSGETTPSGYTHLDSIEYWDEFGLPIANDYSVVKFQIKEMCQMLGWTGLTNTEKDLAIKYYAYPDPTSAVIHLMTTKGMTQQQAQGFVLQSWHRHHLKNIVAYRQRWNYAKFTVLSYISRSDGEDLFNTVKSLVDLYIEVGILGWEYSDNQDGIIDYVYSTHGFTGQGLEENGYQLLQGTWTDFKEALDNVLVCGIYDKYPDIITEM